MVEFLGRQMGSEIWNLRAVVVNRYLYLSIRGYHMTIRLIKLVVKEEEKIR